jgi:hypothetical protein
MLYVPYQVDENIFKKIYSTWEHAYNFLIEIIKQSEQRYMHQTNLAWGDLEHATKEIENKEEQLFNISIIDEKEKLSKHLYSNVDNNYDEYDFENDLQHFKSTRNIRTYVSRAYHIVKQPHILENLEFFNIMRKLNQ